MPMKRWRSRPGQVVVEMLLILPVFLTIVFAIMEMGHLAFWVIVVNHATYEVARIGALRATPSSGGDPGDVNGVMETTFKGIIHSPSASVTSHVEETILDRQAGVMNHDLIVTGSHDVRLIFPLTSLMLSDRGVRGTRTIRTTVRMPIERPLRS